jgi:hypothetical protein
MAKFKVALVGFQSFDTREVAVPDASVELVEKGFASVESLLETVFRYGQNDFQPLPKRSVSSGDIIFLQDKAYRVENIGFSEAKVEALWDEVTFQFERYQKDLKYRADEAAKEFADHMGV